MPTQAELKSLLTYNQETGEFSWIADGRRAGSTHHEGYRIVTIGRVKYNAHRLAWMYVYGVDPTGNLDHIDNNRQNNRIENLREASKIENGHNRKVNANNKSGFKGVSWHTKSKKWKAAIKVNGKDNHLGYFDDPFAAAIAYDVAALKHFGSFARINDIWETL